MWIFRVDEPRLGVVRIREWRRSTCHMIGLLVLLLGATTLELAILDQSNTSFPNKMFATLLIGGIAVSRLTGMLSGDDVMVYRENRLMERKLEQLANHVVMVGFHSLGELVANHLHEAGEAVLVLVGDQNQADRAADSGHLVVLGSPGAFDGVLRRARLDSAKAMVVTTPDSNNNLAITLLAHTLNASLAISVPGENPLRKGLFKSAGASDVIIPDELIANALVSKLTIAVEAAI
jgi:voltage-gated potassium channel